jgi:antitoxin component of MazEF toxin-antitoxin module
MADWREVGRTAAKYAPVLGGVLGGPVGTAIGAVVASTLGVENTPDAVMAAIEKDPEAAVKLAQIEADKSLGLAEILARTQIAKLEAHTRGIEATNRTMEAETKSEHWMQWSWRPFNGFALGVLALMTGATVLLAYLSVMAGKAEVKMLEHIPGMLASMGIIISALSAVVGVSAYQRGKEKHAKTLRGLPTLTDVIPPPRGR